jgi:hypothetical protein
MIIAQCKCGAIELRISAPAVAAVNCHCNLCRGMNGGAFSTYVPVSSAELHFAKGREMLVTFPATPRVQKHWCGICGTPLFNTNTLYPDKAMVYLGALQDHPAIPAKANIYCSSKLPWVDSVRDLKSYAEARQPGNVPQS